MNHILKKTLFLLIMLALTAATLSAETLMMPNRTALINSQVVVWGVSDQANSTAYTIDFGDHTSQSGTIAGASLDRSYIAFTHTYTTAGAMTAQLTVGAQVATTTITVYDSGALTADNLRSAKIDMAIEDGLRYFWYSQDNLVSNFPSGVTTDWSGSSSFEVVPWAALITLAFENHGYSLTNDDVAPTGLYQKYIVRRGLNYVLNSLSNQTLTVKTAGNPCVGTGIEAAPCTGLYSDSGGYSGYMTAVAMQPLAASGALSRHVAEITGTGTSPVGYVVGKTYKEVLQRLANSMAFGQTDNSQSGRGGWTYGLTPRSGYTDNGGFDGSTVGWAVLCLLDAQAAGITIPAFVQTEFAFGFNNALNTDGSFDYLADGSDATDSYVNVQKGGTGLQGLHFLGQDAPYAGGSKGANAIQYISDRWAGVYLTPTSTPPGQDYTGWSCSGFINKGCAYAMFNAFKGLKLTGVTTLPGVTRAAGPGTEVAHDWYADYQDWLTDQGAYSSSSNQINPTSTTGGNWNMGFSCCSSDNQGASALAELILSPVALLLPSTLTMTQAQPKYGVGTNQTLTAVAQTSDGVAVPGATVTFKALSGPSTGTICSSLATDSTGTATCTYTSSTHGTDVLQVSIGSITSATTSTIWKGQPVFGSAYKSARVGVVTTFIVNATDPDSADAVAITANSLPSGATYDTTTHLFTWTAPAPSDGGSTASAQFVASYPGITGGSSTLNMTIGRATYPSATATDPNDPDTDGDGYSDGVEEAAGTDPLDPSSYPSDTSDQGNSNLRKDTNAAIKTDSRLKP